MQSESQEYLCIICFTKFRGPGPQKVQQATDIVGATCTGAAWAKGAAAVATSARKEAVWRASSELEMPPCQQTKQQAANRHKRERRDRLAASRAKIMPWREDCFSD